MVIDAYFDESLREDGAEPICVGGYVFKPTQHERFVRRWHREVLRLPDRRRLTHFHMTDLCAGKGVYRGLTIAERIGILRRAVDVVGDCAYAGLGVQFRQGEFEALAPAEWATYRGSIYSSACGMCVQVTAHWLRRWGCNNIEVRFVFERGHKFQNEANDILNAIAADDDGRKYFKYREHVFAEKNSEYALQAADLFAWSMTKAESINGGAIPSAFRPFAPEVIRLSRRLPGRQNLSFFTGPLLQRYFYEQATIANGHIPVKFGPRRPGLR
jgi:hypothetical protein